jgi:hypothetical protein
MASNLIVTVPPASEPVTLDQARRHCRIDLTADDDLIAIYMTTARTMAERYLSRCLLTQTLLYTVLPEPVLRPDRHFFENPLELPRAPVQSVSSVVVTDDRGNVTTIPPTVVPFMPPPRTGYIPLLGVTPPQVRVGLETEMTDGRMLRNAQIGSLAVNFIAGYGNDPTTVPSNILQAVLMTTAWLYEQRGDVGADLPQAVQWLLDPDRLMWV